MNPATEAFQAELRELDRLRAEALTRREQYPSNSAYLAPYREAFSMGIRGYERQPRPGKL